MTIDWEKPLNERETAIGEALFKVRLRTFRAAAEGWPGGKEWLEWFNREVEPMLMNPPPKEEAK